jgi:hypothetical protein
MVQDDFNDEYWETGLGDKNRDQTIKVLKGRKKTR